MPDVVKTGNVTLSNAWERKVLRALANAQGSATVMPAGMGAGRAMRFRRHATRFTLTAGQMRLLFESSADLDPYRQHSFMIFASAILQRSCGPTGICSTDLISRVAAIAREEALAIRGDVAA